MAGRKKRDGVERQRRVKWDVYNGCFSPPSLLQQVQMALFLLISVLTLMQALPTEEQQLTFRVKSTCNKLESVKATDAERNPYSPVGCNMTMVCRYSTDGQDYCQLRTSTNITVQRCRRKGDPCTTPMKNVEILEGTRTKCSVEVTFVNMTLDMAGAYRCVDLDNINNSGQAQFAERNVEIGYPPVRPQNVTLVYQPGDSPSISLLLNPVNTSQQLNAHDTEWKVQYNWQYDFQPCTRQLSDVKCSNMSAEGLCRPCGIQLKRYASGGQYTLFGNVMLHIKFNISAKNNFGSANLEVNFSALEWVKPGPVSRVIQIKSNTTSVQVRVVAPRKLDEFHINPPPPFNRSPLRLNYTVRLLPEKDQSLKNRESQEFYDTYKFVRNLADDEKAFREALQQLFNISHEDNFSMSSVLRWNSSQNCPGNSTSIKNLCFWITDLPFANYTYNLMFYLQSRYPSDPITDNNKFHTRQTAPQKGPELEDSFVYCPPLNEFFNETSSTCIIYFKEIARVWRGASIQKYTLTLTQVTCPSEGTSTSCKNNSRTISTLGTSNSFYVQNLVPGVMYNISLKGWNRFGTSPPTQKTLLVHQAGSSPLAPRNVVVESNSMGYYDLSWDDGPAKQEGTANGTYFVHYCYHDSASAQAQLFFNCKTNMVTKKVPTDNKNSFSFEGVKSFPDLQLIPQFFVSMVLPDGNSSGLVGVDCFYAKDKVSYRGDLKSVQKSEDDPQALTVTFEAPCYSGRELLQYGKPSMYSIAVVKSGSTEYCSEDSCRAVEQSGRTYITHHDFSGMSLAGEIKETVSGLEANTAYCVGLQVDELWSCKTGSTGSEDFSVVWTVGIMVGFTGLLGVVILICYLNRQYKKQAGKFGDIRYDDMEKISVESHKGEGEEKKNVQTVALPDLTKGQVGDGCQGVENPLFGSSTTSSSITEESEIVAPGQRRPPSIATGREGTHLNQPVHEDDDHDDYDDDDHDSEEEEEEEDEEVTEEQSSSRYHSQPSQPESQVDSVNTGDGDQQTFNNNNTNARYAAANAGGSANANVYDEEEEDEEEEEEDDEEEEEEEEGEDEEKEVDRYAATRDVQGEEQADDDDDDSDSLDFDVEPDSGELEAVIPDPGFQRVSHVGAVAASSFHLRAEDNRISITHPPVQHFSGALRPHMKPGNCSAQPGAHPLKVHPITSAFITDPPTCATVNGAPNASPPPHSLSIDHILAAAGKCQLMPSDAKQNSANVTERDFSGGAARSAVCHGENSNLAGVKRKQTHRNTTAITNSCPGSAFRAHDVLESNNNPGDISREAPEIEDESDSDIDSILQAAKTPKGVMNSNSGVTPALSRNTVISPNPSESQKTNLTNVNAVSQRRDRLGADAQSARIGNDNQCVRLSSPNNHNNSAIAGPAGNKTVSNSVFTMDYLNDDQDNDVDDILQAAKYPQKLPLPHANSSPTGLNSARNTNVHQSSNANGLVAPKKWEAAFAVTGIDGEALKDSNPGIHSTQYNGKSCMSTFKDSSNSADATSLLSCQSTRLHARNNVGDSLENILQAGKGSQLPKNDLLAVPLKKATATDCMNSGSDRDSMCLTSGVECDSENESAKESDASTESVKESDASTESIGNLSVNGQLRSEDPSPKMIQQHHLNLNGHEDRRTDHKTNGQLSYKAMLLGQDGFRTKSNCVQPIKSPPSNLTTSNQSVPINLQVVNNVSKQRPSLICNSSNSPDSSDDNASPTMLPEHKTLLNGSKVRGCGPEKDPLLSHHSAQQHKVTTEDTRL